MLINLTKGQVATLLMALEAGRDPNAPNSDPYNKKVDALMRKLSEGK